MRLTFFFLLLALAGPLLAQDGTYVGSDRCRSCHTKAYDIWASSRHARAQSTLPEERRGELRCLFCHATDAQANLGNYALENVHCEACHGAGARHIAWATKEEEKKDRSGIALEAADEARCRSCHTEVRSPNLRPFQYESALQAIRHW